MSVLTMLRQWFSRRKARRAAQEAAPPRMFGSRFKPLLETLEERLPPNNLLGLGSFMPTTAALLPAATTPAATDTTTPVDPLMGTTPTSTPSTLPATSSVVPAMPTDPSSTTVAPAPVTTVATVSIGGVDLSTDNLFPPSPAGATTNDTAMPTMPAPGGGGGGNGGGGGAGGGGAVAPAAPPPMPGAPPPMPGAPAADPGAALANALNNP